MDFESIDQRLGDRQLQLLRRMVAADLASPGEIFLPIKAGFSDPEGDVLHHPGWGGTQSVLFKDVRTLEECGLLRVSDYNDSGSPLYETTPEAERFLERAAPGVTGSPLGLADPVSNLIFVSYGSADYELALLVKDCIRTALSGGVEVFVARHDIDAGDDPLKAMLEMKLPTASALVAICSEISRSSSWLWWESASVWARGGLVIPLFASVDPDDFRPMTLVRQGRNLFDSDDFDNALKRLATHFDVALAPILDEHRGELWRIGKNYANRTARSPSLTLEVAGKLGHSTGVPKETITAKLGLRNEGESPAINWQVEIIAADGESKIELSRHGRAGPATQGERIVWNGTPSTGPIPVGQSRELEDWLKLEASSGVIGSLKVALRAEGFPDQTATAAVRFPSAEGGPSITFEPDAT